MLADSYDKLDAALNTVQGTEYDYCSVMHYGQYANSKNGLATVTPLKDLKASHIGQRVDFSDGDLLELNMLYKCEK